MEPSTPCGREPARGTVGLAVLLHAKRTPFAPPPAGVIIYGCIPNAARTDGRFRTTVDTVHAVFVRSNGTLARPVMLTTDETQADDLVQTAHDFAFDQATDVWAEAVTIRWDLATHDGDVQESNAAYSLQPA